MITSLLLALAAFYFAVAIIISIHEFGHFITARWFNVKVEKFSIGIGKPSYSWVGQKEGTEYSIAAIPLGGFVRLYGDKRSALRNCTNDKNAYINKPLYARICIVLAGPVFNILLAAFLYWIVSIHGTYEFQPIVIDVKQNSPAYAAGIRSGDYIKTVNNVTVPTWNATKKAIVKNCLNNNRIPVSYLSQVNSIKTISIPCTYKQDISPSEIPAALGIAGPTRTFTMIIGRVINDSPAQLAGLKPDDVILGINNIEYDTWHNFSLYIKSNPDRDMTFTILRGNKKLSIELTTESINVNTKPIGYVGAIPIAKEISESKYAIFIKQDFTSSFFHAFNKIREDIVFSLDMVGYLFSGKISIMNLNGPAGIAQYASITAEEGLSKYIEFIALISISVAILNLLPIPILDGGHFILMIAESFRKKPFSEKFHTQYQVVGLFMVLGLLCVAMYSDFTRLLGSA